jgi:hypothetical protein
MCSYLFLHFWYRHIGLPFVGDDVVKRVGHYFCFVGAIQEMPLQKNLLFLNLKFRVDSLE